MEVTAFRLGPFDNNTYLVSDSGEAVIVDPTFGSDSLIAVIESQGLKITVEHACRAYRVGLEPIRLIRTPGLRRDRPPPGHQPPPTATA